MSIFSNVYRFVDRQAGFTCCTSGCADKSRYIMLSHLYVVVLRRQLLLATTSWVHPIDLPLELLPFVARLLTRGVYPGRAVAGDGGHTLPRQQPTGMLFAICCMVTVVLGSAVCAFYSRSSLALSSAQYVYLHASLG